MKYPGDLTAQELQHVYERFRELAVDKWGEQRAAATEKTLRDASASAARLERLRFSRDDTPGFFLHETAPSPKS